MSHTAVAMLFNGQLRKRYNYMGPVIQVCVLAEGQEGTDSHRSDEGRDNSDILSLRRVQSSMTLGLLVIHFGEWEIRHFAFIESLKMKGIVMVTDTRQLRWLLYGV